VLLKSTSSRRPRKESQMVSTTDGSPTINQLKAPLKGASAQCGLRYSSRVGGTDALQFAPGPEPAFEECWRHPIGSLPAAPSADQGVNLIRSLKINICRRYGSSCHDLLKAVPQFTAVILVPPPTGPDIESKNAFASRMSGSPPTRDPPEPGSADGGFGRRQASPISTGFVFGAPPGSE